MITGFLGAGKTTVLRHLLLNSGQRLAVVVNEFGSVGLDGDLIRSCGFCPEEELEGRVLELNNGCLCCTVQDDFLPTMERLLERSDHLDGIVVETSGLALPTPLLQAFAWPAIRSRVHVNGVVTLVDGEAFSAGSPVTDPEALERQRQEDPSVDHLTAVDELFTDQMNAADLVLISRADRVSEAELDQLNDNLRSRVRDGVPLLPIQQGVVDPSVVLGLEHRHDHAVDHGHAVDHDHAVDENHVVDENHAVDENHSHHDHNHVDLFSGVIRFEGSVDRQSIESALKTLVSEQLVVRLKGRIWLNDKPLPLQLQMVGPRLNSWFEPCPAEAWSPSSVGGVDLVVLSFREAAADVISDQLQRLVSATPLTASNAAITPRH